MGVKACSRNKCKHVMCDIYIAEAGYICYDCTKDFKEWAEKFNKPVTTEAEIIVALREFFKTPAGIDIQRPTTIDEFFNKNSTR